MIDMEIDALDGSSLDPAGFVVDELDARGALVDRTESGALAVLPGALARELALPEAVVLAADAADVAGEAVASGLGSPLLDRLVADVRARVPVASLTWQAEPPRLALAERLAAKVVVRNGVADVLGVAHASATYLAGVFAWTAEADDRYQGLALAIAHAGTGDEPDAGAARAMMALVADDAEAADDDRLARAAIGAAAAVAKRAALAIGPRLEEVGAAVARRRDRERARIDGYFTSLIAEARKPRRHVMRDAIDARVIALRAEHAAKLRDLTARYTLRVRVEPVALMAIGARVAQVRLRLRRRKGEREIALHLPPGARAPDALACVACPGTTHAPLLCDDALHVLCEVCAPEAAGRPRCRACATRRSRGAAGERPDSVRR